MNNKFEYIGIILTCFMILSCSSINKSQSCIGHLNNDDKAIIGKAINKIRDYKGYGAEINHVVYPYFKSLVFDYSSQDKKDVLKQLNWTLQDYDRIQRVADNNYMGRFYKDLFDFSSSQKSYDVFYFSSLNDNVILVKLVTNRYKSSLSDLVSNKKNVPSTINYFALILNENKNIDKILSFGIHYD